MYSLNLAKNHQLNMIDGTLPNQNCTHNKWKIDLS